MLDNIYGIPRLVDTGQETIIRVDRFRQATLLLVREDDQYRLMNTINGSSRFETIRTPRPTPANPLPLADTSLQRDVAIALADGWRQNGGMWDAEFRIVQFDENSNLINEEKV